MKTMQFAKMVAGLGLAFAAAGCSDSGPETVPLTAANAPEVAAVALEAMNKFANFVSAIKIASHVVMLHRNRSLAGCMINEDITNRRRQVRE